MDGVIGATNRILSREALAWVREVRRTRRPGVLRGAGRPLATGEELFEMLCSTRSPLSMRIYADGQSRREVAHLGPLQQDGHLRGWFDRIASTFETRETGVIVNNIHAHGQALYYRGIALTEAIFEEQPLTAGGSGIDLVMGSYRRGFFNVHKDDQDVLTFVVEGHKRFLVWPYAAFEHWVGNDQDPRSLRYNPGPRDYEDEVHRATVLEGGPGDLLFWPSEWWHVAESDGSFSVTSPIGWLHGRRLRQHLQELWAERVVDPVLGADVSPEGREATLRALEDPRRCEAAHRRLAVALQAWTTAAGFFERPLPVEAPAPEDRQVFAAVGRSGWWFCREGEHLRCVAYGQSLRLVASPLVERLLRGIASGEPFVTGDLCAGAEAELVPSEVRELIRLLIGHGLLREVL